MTAGTASIGRRAAACCGAVLVVLAATIGLAPAAFADTTGAGTAAAPPAADPLAALNACLVSRKVGDVLILLDKSGSVKSTDPKGYRIDAAKALLDRLVRRIGDPASEIHGAKLTAAVTTFGDTVFQGDQRVAPEQVRWTGLDTGSLPGLQNEVESLRRVWDGKETNYWAALDWVASAEEAHAGGQPTNGCHLVFWFSDGAPNIVPRGDGTGWPDGTTIRTPWTDSGTSPASTKEQAAAVQAAQKADLQRPGGLSDRLRADKIVLVAVGLTNGGPASRLDIMKGIAENSVAPPYGALPGIGKFFPVTDALELLLWVGGLGESATLLPPDTKPLCSRTPCAQQHTFAIDTSIHSVRLVGSLDLGGRATTPGVRVLVQSPSGATLTIEPAPGGAAGTVTGARIGSVVAGYQWMSGTDLAVDMIRPAAATAAKDWQGTWRVTFVDVAGAYPNGRAATRVAISADLVLNPVSPPPQVQAGEQLQFGLQLTNPAGGAAEVGSPPPAMTGVVAVAQPGSSGATQISAGEVATLTKDGVDWTVPTNAKLGAATVTVTLNVTTITGIRLDPVVRQFDLSLKPAKGSPAVNSVALDFGAVEGTATGSAKLSVVGPGCVWVTGGDLRTHPDGVTGVTIGGDAAAPQSCAEVADGQTRELTVTATPQQAGNGPVAGDVIVHLARQGHADDTAGQQVVPYVMTMQRAPESTVKWGIFAAALLLGIGLPVGVLALTRRIAARYPEDVRLSGARIPVRVGPHEVVTAAGGTPALPTDWSAVPPPTDGRRGLLVAGVRLRARTGPLWSASPGYSEVVDRPGISGSPPFHGRNLLARLPLGVQGCWAILFHSVDELGGPAEQIGGDLLLIISPNADQQARRALLTEALGQGPHLVAGLRDEVRARAGRAGQSGGPGGSAPEPVPAGAVAAGGGAAPGAPGWSTGPSAPVGPTPSVPGWGTSAPSGWPQQPAAAPQYPAGTPRPPAAPSGWPSAPGASGAPGAPGQQGGSGWPQQPGWPEPPRRPT